MKIYEYSPSHDKYTGAAVGVLIVIAFAVFVGGSFVPAYAGLFELAAVALAAAGILLCSRGLLTRYVYTVETSDKSRDPLDDPDADLVITEIRGKVSRVVCRVSVKGGAIRRIRRDTPKPDAPVFNYCPGLFPEDPCWFYPSEAEGGGGVKILPDGKLFRLLGGKDE